MPATASSLTMTGVSSLLPAYSLYWDTQLWNCPYFLNLEVHSTYSEPLLSKSLPQITQPKLQCFKRFYLAPLCLPAWAAMQNAILNNRDVLSHPFGVQSASKVNFWRCLYWFVDGSCPSSAVWQGLGEASSGIPFYKDTYTVRRLPASWFHWSLPTTGWCFHIAILGKYKYSVHNNSLTEMPHNFMVFILPFLIKSKHQLVQLKVCS